MHPCWAHKRARRSGLVCVHAEIGEIGVCPRLAGTTAAWILEGSSQLAQKQRDRRSGLVGRLAREGDQVKGSDPFSSGAPFGGPARSLARPPSGPEKVASAETVSLHREQEPVSLPNPAPGHG